jgi:hypothetical protein
MKEPEQVQELTKKAGFISDSPLFTIPVCRRHARML